MNDIERQIAVLRNWIDEYKRRLETADGTEYAVTKAWLHRTEDELAALLAKQEAA
jgi:hypothetical protein